MKKIILSLILIGILKAFVDVPLGWRHVKAVHVKFHEGYISSAWADALGDTIVVAYKIHTSSNPAEDSIFIKYSEDDGFSWSNPELVESGIDFSSPRITIDAYGNLYMLYERTTTSYTKDLKCIFSDDFGNTWTTLLYLQNLHDSHGSDAGAMMYVESGNPSHIHIVYTRDVSQGQSSKPAVFYIYSLDGGQTWSGSYRLQNMWDGDTLIDECINPKVTVVNGQPHIIYTVHCSSGGKIMVHYTGFPPGGSYTYTYSHIMNAYGPYVDSKSIVGDLVDPNLIHAIYPQEDNTIIHRRIEYNGSQWVWGATSYVDSETDNAKFVDFSIDDEKIFVMISYVGSYGMPHYTYSLDNGNTWSPVTVVQIGHMGTPFTVVANRRSRVVLYPRQPAQAPMEVSFISEDKALFSSTSSATAYNSNRHFVREPNNDNLHLIYTMTSDQPDIVWTRSYDGGSTWEPYKIIGHGAHTTPCIWLNSTDQLLSVAWINTEGAFPQLQYRETGYETSGGWSDIITLWLPTGYEPDDPPGDDLNTPGMPSIVVTGTRANNTLYLHMVLRAKRNNGSPRLIYVKYDLNQLDQNETPVEVPDTVIDEGEVLNPSLAYSNVNNRLKLHCVYSKDDKVYYSEFYRIEWTQPPYQISNIGKVARNPSIEVYGDSLYAVWNEDEGGGKYDAWRRRKKVTDDYRIWSDIELVSKNSDIYDSRYPTNSELRLCLWNEEDHANTDFDPWYRYGNDNPTVFYSTSEQSYFPHGNRYNTGLSIYMYGIWTEKDHLLYKVMSHKRMYVPPPGPGLAYLSYSGEGENSPYLIQRQGTKTYGNITVDIGQNLIYEFDLDTIYNYELEAEFYFESGNARTGRILTSNMAPLTFTYNPGEIKTIKFPIDKRFLVEGNKLYLSFKNLVGPEISLKEIKIYRYENEETGTGGAQSAGVSKPEMSLLKIYPVIAKDKFTLNYTVNSLSPIEVSLYDILGRKVSTLLKEKLMAPGTYSMEFKKPDNLKSGVYFIKLNSNHSKEVKKIIFSR